MYAEQDYAEQDVLAGIGLMQRQIEYLGTRVEEI